MNPLPPPTVLPLFPLGCVLYPGGWLPLRIFELRYLDMVRKCHQAGTPFGVVALTQGAEVRVAGAPDEQFAEVGTLARVCELESPQPGLLQISCEGQERFRIEASERQKNGLWTATVQPLAPDTTLPVPDDLRHVSSALQRLLNALQERQRLQREAGAAAPPLPVRPPHRYDDCGWVANRWCELLPLPTELRQRLMMLDSPLMRLELVSDLLARHRIASG